MDLAGELGFPSNVESVLARWSAIDSMLFVWGSALSRYSVVVVVAAFTRQFT
jgi:hypothetical protein